MSDGRPVRRDDHQDGSPTVLEGQTVRFSNGSMALSEAISSVAVGVARDIAKAFGSKMYIYAVFVPCDEPGTEVRVIVKSHDDLPSAPSIPPAAGDPVPDDHPDREILDIDFTAHDIRR